MTFYIYLMSFVGVFLLSIIFHEVGHALVLRKLNGRDIFIILRMGKKKKLQTGLEKDYQELTDEQLNDVYSIGVISGIIPIFISTFFYFHFIFLIIPYVIGCKTDIRKMIQTSKKEEKKEERYQRD